MAAYHLLYQLHCLRVVCPDGKWSPTSSPALEHFPISEHGLQWKIVPPHMWAAFCVFGWGIAATCQAAAVSWSGMMTARFFLGLFEAAYGPGIAFFLSFFYLRHEIGLRIGYFLIAAPLATCFAGALAYGVTSGYPVLANWRVLFLVEGLPCLVMAAVTWVYLPDSPDKAKFLTPEEKDLARARGVRQVGAGAAHRIGHIAWGDIAPALWDIKVGHPSGPFFDPANHLTVLLTLMDLELLHRAHVFLLQCRLLVPPCLPSDYLVRNGL